MSESTVYPPGRDRPIWKVVVLNSMNRGQELIADRLDYDEAVDMMRRMQETGALESYEKVQVMNGPLKKCGRATDSRDSC